MRVTDIPTEPLILDPADPLPSARSFVEGWHYVDGVLALRHHNGVFYAHAHERGTYREREGAAVRAELYAFLEQTLRWSKPKKGQSPCLLPFMPTKAKVENVLDALKALCILPQPSAAPCWLANDPGVDPLDVLPSPPGLLHIPTRRLLPITPDFFALNGLDFGYDSSAPAPRNWLRFLHDDLWPNDPESCNTLQEVFGYLLTPRTHFQKIVMLIGPKRSGKGTIGRVLRRLLGESNVCGPTLSNLGEQFGLSVLIGKSAAIIADARISGRTDAAIVIERLLSISGEDSLSIPRKYLPDWSGKLSSRFLIFTNELPRIEDASGALASRFIVLTLRHSFYGREDHELFEQFVPELPGILLWALEGYERLYERGHFFQPPSSQELIQQFEDLGSPIGAFLRERCEIGASYEVRQDRVFEAWQVWCAQTGRDRPGTIQMLAKNLRAAVPWLKVTHPRILGVQVSHWEGLRLRVRDED